MWRQRFTVVAGRSGAIVQLRHVRFGGLVQRVSPLQRVTTSRLKVQYFFHLQHRAAR